MLNLLKPLYPLFFRTIKDNPEKTHVQSLELLHKIESNRHKAPYSWLISQFQESFTYENDALQQNIFGLNFSHPLGLAAGFDKDGKGAGIWSSFGFGFAELGAVTLHSQEGNPKPRMFRLPEDKAILNRMGANNQGAEAIAIRLEKTWQRQARSIPMGINLCKSKITPLEEAEQDYLASFRHLYPFADFFVINVSSPNTVGLRSLQAGEQLKPILSTLQGENNGKKPLLIKIAPDLQWEEISSILQLAQEYNLAGIIATNTTTNKQPLKTKILAQTGNLLTEENGGISGLPLKERSTEIIKFIYEETGGNLPIIGVGGIFNADDAWQKITAGASLLQFYSGWVYQGPWVVKEILQGLMAKLEQHNLSHLHQAVGLITARSRNL